MDESIERDEGYLKPFYDDRHKTVANQMGLTTRVIALGCSLLKAASQYSVVLKDAASCRYTRQNAPMFYRFT